MDVAKYISFSTYYSGDKLRFTPDTPVTHRVLPHGAVVTLAGTGSELSAAAMIADDLTDKTEKLCLAHEALCFDFSIVNPELTYTLPAFQTAAGAMDIVSHCMDAYFNDITDAPLMDAYFEGVIRTVMKEAVTALKEPRNYNARANLSLAAMMAWSDNMAVLGTPRDWGAHHCEVNVTTTFNRTHGETLAVITPAWMKYTYKKNIEKYTKWAINCMGVNMDCYDSERTISNGIRRLEDWIRQIGLPLHLSEMGVTLEAIDKAECAKNSSPAGFVYQLSQNEIAEIYKYAE